MTAHFPYQSDEKVEVIRDAPSPVHSLNSMRIVGGELEQALGLLKGHGAKFLDDPLAIELASQLKPNARLVLRAKAIERGVKPDEFDAKVPPPAPKLVEPTNKPGSTPNKDLWKARLIDVQQLCDERFPELKYVVPGIVPEGVTLLASRPKLGKSWLLLQTGSAVATGTVTLVDADTPVCGDVLYLALEDNPRRLQRRLTKYFGAQRENWPKRLTLATSWRRVDQGGIDDLRAWCRSVAGPTLIMIDTLKKMRPPKRQGQTDYDADYEACQGLQELAGVFGVAIIVAHHDRKMDAEDVFDTVSGTLGLTGGVDTVAIIKRGGQGTTLHVEGRDLMETIEKAISFDRETCRWTVLGEASQVNVSAERARVLSALEGAAEGLTVGAIMEAAQIKTRNAADLILGRMVQAGSLSRVGRGNYCLPQYVADICHPRKNGQKERFGGQATENTSKNGNLSDLSLLSGGDRFPADRPTRDAFPDMPPELDRRPNPPGLGPPGDSLDDLE
jgi:hypothetical protein